MKNFKNILSASKGIYVMLLLLMGTLANGQSISQQKMDQLSFMIGDWIGTSKSFTNGVLSSEVPAFQKITYDLDKSILVIELSSETLQLHTIIYYDETEGRYSYNPFSKSGARRLPADFIDGKLIVRSGNSKRFIFGANPDGGFREYGEELIDGVWVTYFEDTFHDVK